MNTIQIIHPYRQKNSNIWVFDDERHGLVAEPFVCGASESITRLVGDQSKCSIAFSGVAIPNYDLKLTRTGDGANPDKKGCHYTDGAAPLWLCPAMCHYFGNEEAPSEIYLKIEG